MHSLNQPFKLLRNSYGWFQNNITSNKNQNGEWNSPPLFFMHASIDSLSLDTLVQILCKLDHDELKRLLLISKSFHDAVLVARTSHFDFSTPPPTKMAIGSAMTTDWSPKRPLLRLECKKPLQKTKLSKDEMKKIAVVLFPEECTDSKLRWMKNHQIECQYSIYL